MLTWGVVVVLALGVYGQRALGMALINPNRISDRSRQVLALVPLSILCAVTALQTFSTQGALVVDARVAGLAAAAALSWKQAPMFVVVMVAAAVTAAVRLI